MRDIFKQNWMHENLQIKISCSPDLVGALFEY